MNLQRKLQIVEQSVRSISTHEDADAAVRHAALDAIEEVVKAERDAINKRVQASVAAALKPEA